MPRKKKSNENEDQRVVLTMRKENSLSMKEILEQTHPQEMSAQEKHVLCVLLPESPELPYPTRELEMAYGPNATEYVIPEERRAEVLRELFPFGECPDIDDTLYDIHERKYFKANEYRVIREYNRNMLVSPYYPISGGMVVDWIPDETVDTFVQKIEM